MSCTVLVVDDDLRFRRLARLMLTAVGLKVVGEAGTWASGAAAAAELRPDAALVDVGLPDGSGIALAEHLAGLPWRPRVVLTSSDPDATRTAAVQRFGAVGFIAKGELPSESLRTMLVGS
jgi:DNA-binding NarL/FixJ family response regulator